MIDPISESFSDLELALDDAGWKRISHRGDSQFSLSGLKQAADICRVMAVANPLIKRGLNLRGAYVFGQGVTLSASTEGQDISAVIQDWWDGNSATFTGGVVQERLERALGTDGNLFLACFTNPLTGQVKIRTIPFGQIMDRVSNPQDAVETWFYRREFTLNREIQIVYYPDICHRPATKPDSIDGHEIKWDAPVMHVKVNDLEGWEYGIGDAYAAITWARSYRDFLADWAVLMKSLSQFAWRHTTEGKRVDRAAQALTRSATVGGGGKQSAGATVVMGSEDHLEPIPKSGATLDSESGKPLAAMVAAALDVPVTFLLSDPGVTGARAVAESLDAPMILAMKARRGIWTHVYQTLAEHVIISSVRAPGGSLRGVILRDKWTGQETVKLSGDADPTVLVDWPTLEKVSPELIIKAIVDADSTGKVPGEVTLRLLLVALGVDDIDEIMEKATDEDGKLVDSELNAGLAAMRQFRSGTDLASS